MDSLVILDRRDLRAAGSVAPDQLAIEALPPRGRNYEISVAAYRGLIVRVLPSGAKRFVFRHRREGRLRRVALRATEIRGAVREWARLRREARLGVDAARRPDFGLDCRAPSDERLPRQSTQGAQTGAERRAETIARLIDRFVQTRADPQSRSWHADYDRLVRYVLPAWGDVPAAALRRGDVHALVGGIARKQPLQANRVLATVQRLFAFGVETGVLDAHACLACSVTHCVVAMSARRDADAAACAEDRRSG